MTEPIHAVTADSGSRYYEHPIERDDNGQPRRYVSVTTALDVINKPGLKFWASYGSAGLAMDELPRMLRAARRPDCGNTRSKQACQECRPCTEYWLGLWHYREAERAKRRGSRIHKYREFWIKHGYWPQVEPEDIPYVDGYERFIRDYGLTPESWTLTECTVLSKTHNYGGTLDGGLVIDPTATLKAAELCARVGCPDEPALVLDDLKTREKPDVAIYQEAALQLTAYRHAEVILLPDGQEIRLPRAVGAIVVQVRPVPEEDGPSKTGVYTCRPVDTSEQTFTAFLCALWMHRWVVDCGDQSVQVGSFPIPEGWAPQVPDKPPVGRPKRTTKKAPPVATETPGDTTPTTTPAAAKKATTAKRTASVPASLRPPDRRPGQTLTDEEIPF